EAMRDQPSRQAGGAMGKLPVTPGMNAISDRRVLWLSAGDVKQMCREGQRRLLRDLFNQASIRGQASANNRSVIVVVVDPEPGPAALAGFPADCQMRPYLNLDCDLAGWWRDALADTDGDPRGDVFSGAECRTARRAASGCLGVQGPGRGTAR